MNHHQAFTAVPTIVSNAIVNERKQELDTITEHLTMASARLSHLLQRRKDIDTALIEAASAATQAQVAAMLGEKVNVEEATHRHAALLQERAVIGQEIETLPAMLGEFKRRAVVADFRYLQQVRSVALAEAERINNELQVFATQQRTVQREIAALTPTGPTSNFRRITISDDERQVAVADREQRETQYSTLMAQSREIAAAAQPTASAAYVAQLAADVARGMMEHYTSGIAGRAISAYEAAEWWAKNAYTAAEREITAAGTFGRRVAA